MLGFFFLLYLDYFKMLLISVPLVTLMMCSRFQSIHGTDLQTALSVEKLYYSGSSCCQRICWEHLLSHNSEQQQHCCKKCLILVWWSSKVSVTIVTRHLWDLDYNFSNFHLLLAMCHILLYVWGRTKANKTVFFGTD